MPQSTPRSFIEKFALKELENNVFETVHYPERMGNSANIAYGGFALALAVKAAHKTVPETYHMYSMLGNYLGPALTDRTLRASVKTIRQTRTFATRQVEISQKQDDGSSRLCVIALADFQVAEKASLLTYSVQPTKKYSHYKDLPIGNVQQQQLVDEGKVSQKLLDAHSKSFHLMDTVWERRPCPEGIFPQNLTGMAKWLPTTQSSLPLAQRSTADWLRSLHPLPTRIDQLTNLGFLIDSAVSFSPLSFSGMFLDDVAACSSLDFAFRVFTNAVDLEKWILREITTYVGGEGRTYSEARVWDEEGNCVACMTQQSIARPWPKKEKL